MSVPWCALQGGSGSMGASGGSVPKNLCGEKLCHLCAIGYAHVLLPWLRFAGWQRQHECLRGLGTQELVWGGAEGAG